jgi:UDP-N-acetylmuramyl pentapeptide synthase
MLSLADVVQGLTGVRTAAWERQPTRVVVDSRHVERGDVFIALRGEQADGHDFVGDALARGAAMAVVHRPVEAQAPLVEGASAAAALPAPLPLLLRVSDSLRGFTANRHFLEGRSTTCASSASPAAWARRPPKRSSANVLARRYRHPQERGQPITTRSACR